MQQTGSLNPISSVDLADANIPAFADLDADGDLDAIFGGPAIMFYYKNTGNANNPSFLVQTGTRNPFNSFNFGGGSSPCFIDLDGERDLDVVVGKKDGDISYLQNSGSAINPAFVQLSGTFNPFNLVSIIKL